MSVNQLPSITWVLGTCLVAAWLTHQLRRYAVAQRVLDVPNERSSHSVATPRGGGVAIVLTMCASVLIAAGRGSVPWESAWAIVGGGLPVAAIGFADDHHPLRPRWRLVGHFAASIWVVVWLGGLPLLDLPGAAASLGRLFDVLGVLYLVWLVNLTNFMDGIDGIAATEAVTVAAGGACVFVLAVPGAPLSLMPLLLAGSAAGFLMLNWPPARIFMGDSGSGFLGLALGIMSLEAAAAAPGLFWSWVILLGVFVVDATLTLVRRALRGDRVYEAHRMHAYQHAAARWGSHARVTLGVAAINLLWLLPWALLVGLQRLDGLTGVVVAYVPLAAVALWLGAGRPLSRSSSPSTSNRYV